MERKKPHHALTDVKAALAACLRMTASCRRDAATLGFDDSGVQAVIATITPTMFYKSMTFFQDATR